jgi:hypothetical protein
MLGNLKRQWRAFRRGKPGHRFQDRHDRTKQNRKTQAGWIRIVQPIIAVFLLAIAVVMTFLPGPGFIFYFAALALLADESRTLARWLDWGELKGRKGLRRFKRWWKQASWPAKGGLIFVGLCAVAGAGYVFYRVFLARSH